MNVREIKEAVRARQNYICADCGKIPTGYWPTLQVHRLVMGSEYSLEGTVALCHHCHCRRHLADKTWGRQPTRRRKPITVSFDQEEIHVTVAEEGNVRLSATPRGVAVVVGNGYVIYKTWDEVFEVKERAEKIQRRVAEARAANGRKAVAK